VLVYILRRLVAAFFILIGASFIVYILLTYAGDPLEFTRGITNPTQRAAAQRSVTEALNLDTPRVWRYVLWLKDLIFSLDARERFGNSARTNLPVWDDLTGRMLMTLKLVSAATFASIFIGVSVGIVSALRQYSGFDYLVTFVTFVFFSVPVFWVAVILKSWGGINFNDWLRDGAHFSVEFIALAAVLAAVIGYSIAGGRWPRKAVFGVAAAAGIVALLAWMSSVKWMLNPGLGPIVFALLALAIAVGVTVVMAGWRNAKARNSALTAAVVGIALYFPIQGVLDGDLNVWKLRGLGVVAVLVGVAIGYAWGGYDKGQSARTAAIVAVLCSVVVFVDRAMQSWAEYSASSVIRNRPIKTIGDRESRLEGSFWVITDNTLSHLILPTMALMLISLASYTRYSRASMLEVLNQDYIRTARAKGLTERTVVVRHGFRNAMIPLATIVAFDVGGILGGAVFTETVFEWNAMGSMFIDGLRNQDPNPVMAFFVVIATFAIVFNLIADIVYAVLDPRIRIGA